MLLVSDEFYIKLKASISKSHKNILITSAFVKERALRKLLGEVPIKVNVVVVARWRKHDLLMGASDISVYKQCRENGWKFGIDQNLHGKLFLIDDTDVFLGSANLTQKGMSLGGHANLEFGTRFDASNIDLERIHYYRNSEVTWLDEATFEKMLIDIEHSKANEELFNTAEWSQEILELVSSPVESLWVSELIFSKPTDLSFLNLDDPNMAHDFELLNLDHDNLNKAIIEHQFRQSRLYGWLWFQLSNIREMNFGSLSKALHNSLFDDPLPYRKKIKEFITILFSWFEFMENDFVVTKHSHTSSVRLCADKLVEARAYEKD